MPPTPDASLTRAVREHCAAVAATARWIAIDTTRAAFDGGIEGLDAELHFLDAEPGEVARYVLVLDAINFGSAWFGSLMLSEGESGTVAITRALTDHARRQGGTWSADALRSLTPAEVAEVLGQPAGHELMGLYAEALRQLGSWLGDSSALERIAASGGSADAFARSLAAGMPLFDDVGFYKRAQITANDLVHAGVARFGDIDSLTAFADNLVPHVLRMDGILTYAPELAARVDAGVELEPGSAMEVEIRACAVHACELLAREAGVAPRTLDNWLWNRGESDAYRRTPTHRTRTVFY